MASFTSDASALLEDHPCVQQRPGRGRCYVADRDFAADEIILRDMEVEHVRTGQKVKAFVLHKESRPIFLPRLCNAKMANNQQVSAVAPLS